MKIINIKRDCNKTLNQDKKEFLQKNPLAVYLFCNTSGLNNTMCFALCDSLENKKELLKSLK